MRTSGGQIKCDSFEKTASKGLDQLKNVSITSFQHGLLESRFTWMFPDVSLRGWMPAIPTGITVICIFVFCGRA